MPHKWLKGLEPTWDTLIKKVLVHNQIILVRKEILYTVLLNSKGILILILHNKVVRRCPSSRHAQNLRPKCITKEMTQRKCRKFRRRIKSIKISISNNKYQTRCQIIGPVAQKINQKTNNELWQIWDNLSLQTEEFQLYHSIHMCCHLHWTICRTKSLFYQI